LTRQVKAMSKQVRKIDDRMSAGAAGYQAPAELLDA
jgi:hypothetical protein